MTNNTRSLLVGGCSITHGLETVVDQWSLENTQYSFAKYIADHINSTYTNVAYPGASNELIFHRVIAQLLTQRYTDCLIGWTSLHRESWEKDDISWTFNFNYGSARDNKSSELPFLSEIKNVHSNMKEKVVDVIQYYKVLPIRLLTDDLESKLMHYRYVINSICNQQCINLVEINAIENTENLYVPIGPWTIKGKHPNVQEHKDIANQLIKLYYAET